MKNKIKIEVHDTIKDTSHLPVRSGWCECENPEFLCYVEDNFCKCGVNKHHVHCVCGGISQVG
jgi:hypothetical protein